ncbi:DMT family transporter, partial [Serratia sp. (in: enterobacteria)]
MDSQSEKTLVVTPAHPAVGHSAQGWMNGFLGMMIFSGSLPATRVAVLELDPLFLTAIRAAIAALLALCALRITRQARPTRADLPPLLFVALGVVIGFPLLTALALQHTTSAHSLVYIGLLPLATAGFGVLRGGERPKPAFWAFSGVGAVLVGAFALSQGSGGAWQGDALMVGAVLLCGLGYAEGAVLSRRIGGWQA